MKDEKKEKNIFNFDSDSDDKQEIANEEENYSNQKNNLPSPSNDEKKKSPEAEKLEKHVNELLNKNKKKYDTIYETYYAFFIKNEEISSKFEKRAKNEETLYGYFIPDDNDEELLEKRIMRLKEKGLEKLDREIMVSPPENYNIYDLYSIIICRFILGKNVGLKGEKELSEIDKEKYLKNNYDTVYKVASNLNHPKSYYILKKENIELYYFIKLKEKFDE